VSTRTFCPLTCNNRQFKPSVVREFRLGSLGQTRPVLWEPGKGRDAGGIWSGLTDNYLRVKAQSDRDLGNVITDARLTGLDGDWVTGEVA